MWTHLFGLLLAGAAAVQVPASDRECVTFASHGRLQHGLDFSVPLPRGLELRLSSERAVDDLSDSWDILVKEALGTEDFLWVVSPPFRTAPHRMIGAGYGLTARESVQIQRDLRFVLNRAAYEAAVKIVETEPAGTAKMAALERLGQGTLTVRITGYEVHEGIKHSWGTSDGLEWIEFEGRACVPR
ncbi:MAG: hypothetical protein MUE61_16835 [Vicinamibacterales bacterium]|jgi:hypothetical protein|nr:hypothetical protein [Vicinamibacterales bacterium]